MRGLADDFLLVLTSPRVSVSTSTVSIEGKGASGYPNGRVFGGPDLAIGPWEEWGHSDFSLAA